MAAWFLSLEVNFKQNFFFLQLQNCIVVKVLTIILIKYNKKYNKKYILRGNVNYLDNARHSLHRFAYERKMIRISIWPKYNSKSINVSPFYDFNT